MGVSTDLNLVLVAMTITADHVRFIAKTSHGCHVIPTQHPRVHILRSRLEMAEKEQGDVEMKDVSDEPKSDAEGGKEKVPEKAKDVNLLTIEGMRCYVCGYN